MTPRQLEEKRHFAGAKNPSMKRRSDINNYHGRHVYMLTLVVEGRRPLLGSIDGKEDVVQFKPSSLGNEVMKCWYAIPKFHPEVKLLGFQLMPDHLHGILFVKEEKEKHLGQVVSGFKSGCNKAYRTFIGEAVPLPAQSEYSDVYAYEAAMPLPLPSEYRLKKDDRHHGLLFERGYNDLIAKGYDMLPRMTAYIIDNPRRLAARRAHPDYFRVRFDVEVAGQTYAAIGNRFLLTHPEKVQVQLSRSLTKEQVAERVQHYLALARQGAVLVSPAISEGERAVMRAALDERLPLIFLTPWGFTKFSKPGHQYFEACSKGRFLILAPWEHQNEHITLTRTMCLSLNSMTKQICKL